MPCRSDLNTNQGSSHAFHFIALSFLPLPHKHICTHIENHSLQHTSLIASFGTNFHLLRDKERRAIHTFFQSISQTSKVNTVEQLLTCVALCKCCTSSLIPLTSWYSCRWRTIKTSVVRISITVVYPSMLVSHSAINTWHLWLKLVLTRVYIMIFRLYEGREDQNDVR